MPPRSQCRPRTGAKPSAITPGSASGTPRSGSRMRRGPCRRSEQAAGFDRTALRPRRARRGQPALRRSFRPRLHRLRRRAQRGRDARLAARPARERSRHRDRAWPQPSRRRLRAAPGESARMTISTHVLDTSVGRPAAAVAVQLLRHQGSTWIEVFRGETNADGRVPALLPEGTAPGAGAYRLTFDVGGYFQRQGGGVLLHHDRRSTSSSAAPTRTITCRCSSVRTAIRRIAGVEQHTNLMNINEWLNLIFRWIARLRRHPLGGLDLLLHLARRPDAPARGEG